MLKPINCPGHCLIFDSRDRSSKELPICMAGFDILHRHEASGALISLTYVRRFVQDDTRILHAIADRGRDRGDVQFHPAHPRPVRLRV